MDDAPKQRLATVALLIFAFSAAIGSLANAEFQEGFEGTEPSWSVGPADAKVRLGTHARVQGVARSGSGSEVIAFSASNGTHVYFEHRVPASRIIDELNVSIWIKGNRPGVRLYARAVLPRSLDPKTGQPITTWLAGASYEHAGIWQQLRVAGLPKILARQTRVLRSELGSNIDPGEAYIDAVAINAYGGQGPNQLWIDDLRASGVVSPANIAVIDRRVRTASAEVSLPSEPLRPVLRGGVLYLADRAILPRILTYRGEPLQQIAKLGFNIVAIPFSPKKSWEEEAARLGLWIIAPPPPRERLDQPQAAGSHPRILAWHLGDGLGKEQLSETRDLASAIRRWDSVAGRPLIVAPAAELRAYSRLADIVVLGREPLGTTLGLDDYARWLAWQPKLARPGTAIWLRIQTDYAEKATQQWTTGPLAAGLVPAVDPFQIRQLVWSSVAAGARGLWFNSRSSLADVETHAVRRALALEWTNLELAMIEPWVTGGSFATIADSDDALVRATVLQTDRARLLLPTRGAANDQFVPGRTAGGTLAFVVPGIPESNSAFQITPVSFQPLRHRRVAGGIRVVQERYGEGSMILLTGDPRMSGSFAARVRAQRNRASNLVQQLVGMEWSGYESVSRNLTVSNPNDALARTFQSAQQSLRNVNAAAARGDQVQVYQLARRSLALLGDAKRRLWDDSVSTWPSPVTSPYSISFAGLPGHWRLAQFLRTCRRMPNQLPSGGLEDLSAATAAGWKHSQYPLPGIATDVQLSPENPHSGRASLRLSVKPSVADAAGSPAGVDIVETAPVWITSAPVSVAAGNWIRISGFVRIPAAITASVDGLMIFDSLGGSSLALRLNQTSDWQEFTLYRVAPFDTTASITFALTGIGEAWIDDVAIELLRGGPSSGGNSSATARRTKK